MNAPALLTEDEAAAELHICTRTLRKARQEGRLHFVKIGRRICYTPDDLASFIDASRQCNAERSSAPPKPILRSRNGGKIIPFSERARR